MGTSAPRLVRTAMVDLPVLEASRLASRVVGGLLRVNDAARIQGALGELNDAAVAGAWLTEVAERLDGPAAFAAGQMAQQLVVEARTHDKRWRTAHHSMTKHIGWFS